MFLEEAGASRDAHTGAYEALKKMCSTSNDIGLDRKGQMNNLNAQNIATKSPQQQENDALARAKAERTEDQDEVSQCAIGAGQHPFLVERLIPNGGVVVSGTLASLNTPGPDALPTNIWDGNVDDEGKPHGIPGKEFMSCFPFPLHIATKYHKSSLQFCVSGGEAMSGLEFLKETMKLRAGRDREPSFTLVQNPAQLQAMWDHVDWSRKDVHIIPALMRVSNVWSSLPSSMDVDICTKHPKDLYMEQKGNTPLTKDKQRDPVLWGLPSVLSNEPCVNGTGATHDICVQINPGAKGPLVDEQSVIFVRDDELHNDADWPRWSMADFGDIKEQLNGCAAPGVPYYHVHLGKAGEKWVFAKNEFIPWVVSNYYSMLVAMHDQAQRESLKRASSGLACAGGMNALANEHLDGKSLMQLIPIYPPEPGKSFIYIKLEKGEDPRMDKDGNRRDLGLYLDKLVLETFLDGYRTKFRRHEHMMNLGRVGLQVRPVRGLQGWADMEKKAKQEATFPPGTFEPWSFQVTVEFVYQLCSGESSYYSDESLVDTVKAPKASTANDSNPVVKGTKKKKKETETRDEESSSSSDGESSSSSSSDDEEETGPTPVQKEGTKSKSKRKSKSKPKSRSK